MSGYSLVNPQVDVLFGGVQVRWFVQVVITDHMTLKWLNSIESPSGRTVRWALELQQFQFDVQYRRGKLNVVVDALSRQPLEACRQAVEEQHPDRPHACWKNSPRSPKSTRTMRQEQPKLSPPGTQCRRRRLRAVKIVGRRQSEAESPECHIAPMAGHQWVRKTITRLAQRYYWPGMFRDAARHVRCCEVCQSSK
ncbi:uncharacterized protein LOC135437463 [Drosophila montana]|uniref:uncharacterized protein LOC135437463 n=1 Tax=Drosophila montana TaxID=40370 RepID=UPI00313A8FBC